MPQNTVPIPNDPSRPGFGAKLMRGYQAIAVIFLNTCIGLFLLLLAVQAWFSTPYSIAERGISTGITAEGIGINYPYSSKIDYNSFTYTPPQDVLQMAHEFDVFASQGHWQIHPLTGLTLRPFSGKHLNIDPDGYRINPPPDPNFAHKPPYVVWAFGGSTLFGQNLPDSYTLAAQLQVILQSHLPDYQVHVMNYGVPWYYSTPEMALFAEHLRRQPAPQVAFFLDGLNEMHAIDSHNVMLLINRLAGVWEQQITAMTQPEDQPWFTINYSFPPNRLAHHYGLVQAEPQELLSYNYALAINPDLTDPVDYGAEQYVTNMRMSAALGDLFNVPTYFFLQPIPSYDDNPKFLQFQEVVRQTEGLPERFIDLTRALDQADQHRPLLVDPTHYSDYASRFMADVIAQQLLVGEGFYPAD